MNCQNCNKEAGLITVHVLTGKRGRPPKKNVCAECSSLPIFKLPDEKTTPGAKSKKVKLNTSTTSDEFESILMSHPPSRDGWLCDNMVERESGTAKCGMYMSGKYDKCLVCNTPRPEEPTYIWPIYLEVCRKLGKEPVGV